MLDSVPQNCLNNTLHIHNTHCLFWTDSSVLNTYCNTIWSVETSRSFNCQWKMASTMLCFENISMDYATCFWKLSMFDANQN